MVDAAVVDAARAGEDWAWDRLYRSIAPQVRGFLISRGASDPDGLLGDVFLQAAEGIHRFEGGSEGFRAWVFTIARRRLIDERRRRGRRRTERLDQVPEPIDPVDVEGEAIGAARRRELFALLDDLTEAQRDVMMLRVVGGLTQAEVAEVVGKSVGAVKVMQHRALQRLRSALPEDVTL
jgi:RNA polymerase sigma-70 factor (ECF subfamily)